MNDLNDPFGYLDVRGPNFAYLGHFREDHYVEQGHNEVSFAGTVPADAASRGILAGPRRGRRVRRTRYNPLREGHNFTSEGGGAVPTLGE